MAEKSELEILQEKFASLEGLVTEQQTQIDDLSAENKELQTQLEKAMASNPKAKAAPTAKRPTVTIDKKKYQFKNPRFNILGKDFSAEDVAKDKKLCAELLDGYPGLFIEK